MNAKSNIYKSFDHLGILAFLFFLGESIYRISGGEHGILVYLALIISLGGLLVDGYLVFFYKEEK